MGTENPISLGITFRHFKDARLEKLGPINVIIGQNNAGKTSIFRAIANLTGEKRSSVKIGLAPLEFDEPWFQEQLGCGERVVAVSSGSQKPAIGALFFISRDGEDYRMSARISNEDFKSINKQLGSARASVEKWLKYAFFLWHRRKSHIEEAQAVGNFDSLDPEAEHLASRLNAILAGKNSVSVASKINDFMDAVIPGIGHVFIGRDTKPIERGGPQETFLSAKFDTGAEVYGLDSLGGGVEQVLAIALVLVAEDNSSALFIEEPEAHLHELAQRRLVEQIENHRGERQIFIASHSPVFMNAFQDACIYQVTRDAEGNGQVKKCVDLRDQRAALDDVGVLPSTLLQTNCVVWVEGPTEVVLVEHWLSIVAPELKVHQHYEFALTNGANLKHYDADTDSSAHVDVFKICRHNFLLADRDAAPDEEPSKNPVQELRGTLRDECCWITWGHEIEWYFPTAAVQAKWKVKLDEPGHGAFYPKLAESAQKANTAGKWKVKNARAIVKWAKEQSDLSAAWFGGEPGKDLRDNLKRLVSLIRTANDLRAPGTDACPECHRLY